MRRVATTTNRYTKENGAGLFGRIKKCNIIKRMAMHFATNGISVRRNNLYHLREMTVLYDTWFVLIACVLYGRLVNSVERFPGERLESPLRTKTPLHGIGAVEIGSIHLALA